MWGFTVKTEGCSCPKPRPGRFKPGMLSATVPAMSALVIQNSISIKLDRPSCSSAVSTFHSFSPFKDGKEHVAISFGDFRASPAPLVRIHSECLTGDIFGSSRCDCGDQLDEALRLISTHGGILLYLRQEGRGIGLNEKLKAYALQDRGFDTFMANQMLGHGHDERTYDMAADMLKALGVSRIRLITNNPEKHQQLSKHGVDIQEIIPTGVFLKTENMNYLSAKAKTAGHNINLKQTMEIL